MRKIGQFAAAARNLLENLLTNETPAVIIFKHVCESVGMVDKHV